MVDERGSISPSKREPSKLPALVAATLMVFSPIASACASPPPPNILLQESEIDYNAAVNKIRLYVDGSSSLLTDAELDQTITDIMVGLQRMQGYTDIVQPNGVNFFPEGDIHCGGNEGVTITFFGLPLSTNICQDEAPGRFVVAVYEKMHTKLSAHMCFEDYFACNDKKGWGKLIAHTGAIMLIEKIFPGYQQLIPPFGINTPPTEILPVWLSRTKDPDKALVAIIRGDNQTLKEILGVDDPRHWEMLVLLRESLLIYTDHWSLMQEVEAGKIEPNSPDLQRYYEFVNNHTRNIDRLAKFVLHDPTIK
ncbi:hypothetical protein A3A46_00430 [Candidatus Roizmanbacteria bacterium RIFCSPLOWO2_01_FULL_37_13]|nr:MAG: hypothetical protein A3F58_00170 [Candidatus Roizmanbacteria bacterium RIFCSPHIGHO2_12_FULL_37_9b]OGK42360.1 MAG: hypothetical protein A3A46_00430 [Candidatus Roizmanbacteria bacterium RIFCSPLOWO2_01_FULL_37_13]